MSNKSRPLERFGKYLILDHLIDGGMAKICRARYLGEQADKVVAIKMVQPQFSQDESFKTMFMDEIKVTFGLIHPNIVQTYDYGLHQGQLFVAMEYCDGRNLKEYLDKLKEKRFVFPVEISVYIITQVCQGLHYAHTLTDKLTGKEANIIHRDISPHNIMLTYDGAIKVIDFGIAKAETNTESTQAGTIKGKLSYLAPEYLEGQELKPNYDQFAVGITLWEMLCSRKLFKAANDLAVLKKIQECKIPPPSSINPNVPRELDDIVLKSLSREPTERYENMDKLNRAMIKFLYTNYPDFNSSDLSYFAKELFKEDIKKDREKLFEFGKIDLTPYLNDLKKEKSGGTGEATQDSDQDEGTGTVRREQVLDFGFEEEGEEAKSKTSIMKLARQKASEKKEGTQVSAGGTGSRKIKKAQGNKKKKTSKVGKKSRSEVTASRSFSPNRKVKASGRKISKKVVGKSPAKSKGGLIKWVAMLAILLGSAGLWVSQNMQKVKTMVDKGKSMGEDRSPTAMDPNKIFKRAKEDKSKEGAEAPALVGDGSLTIKNFDDSRDVLFVNGERAEVGVLGDVKNLPLLKDLILRVQRPGKQHFVAKIKLTSTEPSKSLDIPEMPSVSYGYLIDTRGCFQGKIFFTLFGERRVEEFPLQKGKRIPFPIQAVHDVQYQPVGRSFKKQAKFSLNLEGDVKEFCSILGLGLR